MAKLLKSILGNVKKLEGVKSSSVEKLDLGGYTPKSGDEQKFVKKHSVEKFADRAGNTDVPYKPSTKEAPYQKQNPAVYEDAMSDTEGCSTVGAQAAPAATASSAKKFKTISVRNSKKTNEEKVIGLLGHLSENTIPFKFLNGEKAVIAPDTALAMIDIFESLTEDNKKKFIDIAFNSPEEFNNIAKLKG